MTRPLLSPVVAMALLALWISPGASAVAVGLHVAIDHHAGEGEEHDLSLADLAKAAVHGHYHDLAASAHEHRVAAHGPTPAPRPSLNSLATVPTTAGTEASIEGLRVPARTARRGPPAPLFSTNCTLLL